jgi:hypothetical protein
MRLGISAFTKCISMFQVTRIEHGSDGLVFGRRVRYRRWIGDIPLPWPTGTLIVAVVLDAARRLFACKDCAKFFRPRRSLQDTEHVIFVNFEHSEARDRPAALGRAGSRESKWDLVGRTFVPGAVIPELRSTTSMMEFLRWLSAVLRKSKTRSAET